MKYVNFVGAYNVLQKMMNMNFDVRSAYAISKLIKELEPVAQFALQRERDLIVKYDATLKEDGLIEFIHGDDDEARAKGMENLQNYRQEMSEMYEMEIDEKFTPITLRYDAFGDQQIAPSEILALDGFVSFE